MTEDKISAALEECRRTYRDRGDGQCHLPDYLAARRSYHALLVRVGVLDPALADQGTNICRVSKA